MDSSVQTGTRGLHWRRASGRDVMTSGTAFVTIEKREAVAVLSIDNPPLNLLTQSVRSSLAEAFTELGHDKTVRAIVLASGPSHFCAGADMTEFPERFDPRVARRHGLNGQRMILAIAGCTKPVVAAIEGACLGGGMEIALACDIRIAAEGARLGLPEIRRGVWPGTGGMFLLARLIGAPSAKKLAMMGDVFEPGALAGYPILDAVVPDRTALEVAISQAEVLAARPARSIRTIKRLLDSEFLAAFEIYLCEELEAYVSCYQTEDAREGNRAFFEKRDPRWSHR